MIHRIGLLCALLSLAAMPSQAMRQEHTVVQQKKSPITNKKMADLFAGIAQRKVIFTKGLQAFFRRNVTLRDNKGNTLLHNALLFHHTALAESLFKLKNLDVNIKNDKGQTPLMLAVMTNNLLITKKNIEKQPNLLDVFSSLKIAYALSNQEIIECLENYIKNNQPIVPFVVVASQPLGFSYRECLLLQEMMECAALYEKFKSFEKAKASLSENPEKILNILESPESQSVRADWRHYFTEQEVMFLESGMSEGTFYWLLNFFRDNQDKLSHYSHMNEATLFSFCAKHDVAGKAVIDTPYFIRFYFQTNLKELIHNDAAEAILSNLLEKHGEWLVHLRDEEDNTPLHIAIFYNLNRLRDKILLFNPNLHARNCFKQKPFDCELV